MLRHLAGLDASFLSPNHFFLCFTSWTMYRRAVRFLGGETHAGGSHLVQTSGNLTKCFFCRQYSIQPLESQLAITHINAQ